MKTAILPTALLCALVSGSAGATDAPTLDVSSVRRVSITGDASRLRFTTSADQPTVVSLTSRPSGWLGRWSSFWFASDCRTSSDMSVTDGTLTIRIVPTAFADLSDCAVTVEANLPAGGDISIDQAATQASLQGEFGAIHLDSHAADVDFEGHAASIVTTGDAMRLKLAFTSAGEDESISLTSRALDADLRFGGVPISYRVDAMASMVDSTLDDTPGARPALLIKADFARAKIR